MKKKLKDFNKRLSDLKKLNSKIKNQKKNKGFKDFGVYLKSGVELVSAIIIALVIGLFLDNYLQKSIFREFNGIFDLVYVLESITNLAESVSSLNNSLPSRTEKASLARIKNILGI